MMPIHLEFYQRTTAKAETRAADQLRLIIEIMLSRYLVISGFAFLMPIKMETIVPA